jgi:predicted CoA-substrate-specific enzyme activase
MEQNQPKLISTQKTKGPGLEPLRDRGTLCIGIDIGSTSSDLVILDDENRIVLSDYRRTKGKPIETFRTQLQETLRRINPADVEIVAATGSAARLPAHLLGIPFINEVAAQAAAISHLYPQIQNATIIEMGGQDSKLIFLHNEPGAGRVKDFALNTVCAAGTGSFIDQQADRLGINIEDEFGRLSLQSKNVPRMAGRCSVFAKSDMIHLQQQATPMCDILAGLCLALARNLKSNLGCGREFIKPIVFTGGVAANAGVVRAVSEVFETKPDELLVPDAHFFTGAIGAVLVSKSKALRHNITANLLVEKIDEYIRAQGTSLTNAPRRDQLETPALPPPQNSVHNDLLANATEPIEAYIGVDVGSLSTKAVVMDKQKRILAKIYLMTAGRPLDAIHQVMQSIGEQVKNKVKIIGAASTGSGRYLTGDFIGADVVINEITAQATGAAIINPKVDTIFEIGGQDSKYISLNNGVVVDFEMNHACAAGTGSFLEEQAQRLGISIKDEFARLAFASKSPIKLGERCTVFMESDLLSYQQQGASTEDLVAGLSYSIVANYLNRVVGRRKIGDNICFQGGTAFNKAVWAAFEKVTGKPIMVPDHHEVTGALGAAAIAAEYMAQETPNKSKFKGFENLVNADYTVESFACEHCSNHCEIKKVQLVKAEPLYYGSRCDRYNLKKKDARKSRFNTFAYRQEKLLEFAGLNLKSKIENRKSKTIGIPMALASWQLLPMFGRFFKELGFEVVLSGRTSKETIRKGVESVTAQPCFPIKIANGHVLELIEKGVDFIFLPSIVSTTANFPTNKHNHFCPYVQSFPYQVRAAFGDKLGNTKLLICPLRLGEGDNLAKKTFVELGKRLNVSPSKTRLAMEKGFEAQKSFDEALRDKGREILASINEGEKLFVLVSRPYNGCDEGVSLQLPKKFADAGVEIIPMEMLDFNQARLSDEKLHGEIYWAYGQKILRAAEIIKRDERLFAVYLSNFSCGPDSFLMPFFKDIMGDKPCLQLEIDEHSADAGVVTRIEAFLESLKNYKPSLVTRGSSLVPQRTSQNSAVKRTLYVPYMSDASYGMAACLRAYGQPAEVMPMADEQTLMRGRAYTTGKECLPCAITSGEMLKVLSKEGVDPSTVAFFMPGASGPCRFGLYHCMQNLVLKYAGVDEALVVAPNQDSNFYRDLVQNFDGSTALTAGGTSLGAFMKDIWTAAVGIDLLQKVILRLRPFAAEPKQAQQVYEKCLKRWVEHVEKRGRLSDMVRLFEQFGGEFSKVKLNHNLRKPRIGIVGEIYVRNHPFANLNIISRLEELGAACDLAPLAEWIYYTNFTRSKMARRRKQIRSLFTNAIQDFFQHRIERALAAPLEKRFGRLAEHPVEHVIELAKPYLDASFEGEAILSIGKIVEYHKDGFGGVVNVMPFTCMPSTIVSTQTRRLSANCGEMPILNLSFDGQEDVTLTTRLEAFVEQVASREKVGIAEMVAY